MDHFELAAPIGRHTALLPPVLHDQLAAELGIDPAAEPELPTFPVWPDYRPVSRRDMDTGELPTIQAELAPQAGEPTEPASVLAPAAQDPAEVHA